MFISALDAILFISSLLEGLSLRCDACHMLACALMYCLKKKHLDVDTPAPACTSLLCICKYCGRQVYSLLTYILKDDLKNLNRKILCVYCLKQLCRTTNLFRRTVICHSLHDCVSTGVLCVIAHMSIDETLCLCTITKIYRHRRLVALD